MLAEKRRCYKCSNSYPVSFRYCPLDAAELENTIIDAGEAEYVPRYSEEKNLDLPRLLRALGLVALAGIVCGASLFLFQVLRPQHGELNVTTTPSGAIIYVDGKLSGSSPVTLEALPSGRHQTKAIMPGYKGYIQHVEVTPDMKESLNWTLEPDAPEMPYKGFAELTGWKHRFQVFDLRPSPL